MSKHEQYQNAPAVLVLVAAQQELSEWLLCLIYTNHFHKFFLCEGQQAGSLQVNLLPLEDVNQLELLFKGHYQLILLALQLLIFCTQQGLSCLG